jgi:hypothetical protein
MKLEHHKQKVASFPKFLFRLGRYALFAAALITFSVFIGTIGYRYFGHYAGWIVFICRA